MKGTFPRRRHSGAAHREATPPGLGSSRVPSHSGFAGHPERAGTSGLSTEDEPNPSPRWAVAGLTGVALVALVVAAMLIGMAVVLLV
ncbi:DUF6480 family protein [Yinghuangia sp. YIM S09857]|uniref:DUF6480 family protein n=1 Tax=Yinghuangia sp. YIM S09857 TaxID=3436929 RepID=UPI003F539B7D